MVVFWRRESKVIVHRRSKNAVDGWDSYFFDEGHRTCGSCKVPISQNNSRGFCGICDRHLDPKHIEATPSMRVPDKDDPYVEFFREHPVRKRIGGRPQIRDVVLRCPSLKADRYGQRQARADTICRLSKKTGLSLDEAARALKIVHL